MVELGNLEGLMRALIAVTARVAFPEDKLLQLISPIQRGRDKLLRAYCLCDGTRTQADIVKASKLDPGFVSRTLKRWIDSGILFRLGAERTATFLHAYPLSPECAGNGKHQRKGQSRD